ncbi:nnf1 domain-containing protein [Sarocladium implicatum]|nr:nnf1 domain-containing protein [Sarocladium implicatum]
MAASRQSRDRSADASAQQLQTEHAQATTTQPRDDQTQHPSSSQQRESSAAAQRQSQEQQTPASPPLPQRHTAVTPGPRASRFRELYAQSLRRTLGKAGWENFSSCYPTVAKNAEGVLKQVQGQMMDKLGEKCEREFESIMTQRQVVLKLNELESLISEAADRRKSSNGAEPTPPHLLPPSTILSAHLHSPLSSHAAQLTARLSATQSQNALLHEEVTRQREEMATLLAKLEGVEGDVKRANEVLSEVVEDLAREAREGEAVLTKEGEGQK